MKKKTLETLTNELNRLVHKRETSQKSCILTLEKLNNFMSYMIKLHKLRKLSIALIRRRSEQGTKIHDSDEVEFRLVFYRSFSTFCNILVGLCTQAFYSLV